MKMINSITFKGQKIFKGISLCIKDIDENSTTLYLLNYIKLRKAEDYIKNNNISFWETIHNEGTERMIHATMYTDDYNYLVNNILHIKEEKENE
jgi:hypothetical protein